MHAREGCDTSSRGAPVPYRSWRGARAMEEHFPPVQPCSRGLCTLRPRAGLCPSEGPGDNICEVSSLCPPCRISSRVGFPDNTISTCRGFPGSSIPPSPVPGQMKQKHQGWALISPKAPLLHLPASPTLSPAVCQASEGPEMGFIRHGRARGLCKVLLSRAARCTNSKPVADRQHPLAR